MAGRRQGQNRVNVYQTNLKDWIDAGKPIESKVKVNSKPIGTITLDKKVKFEDFEPLYLADNADNRKRRDYKIRHQLPKDLFLSHGDCILLHVEQSSKVYWIKPQERRNKDQVRWYFDITLNETRKEKKEREKRGIKNKPRKELHIATYALHAIVFGGNNLVFENAEVKKLMDADLYNALRQEGANIEAHHYGKGYIEPKTDDYDVISDGGVKVGKKKVPLLNENEKEIEFIKKPMHGLLASMPDADEPFEKQKEYANKVRANQSEQDKNKALFWAAGDKDKTGRQQTLEQDVFEQDANEAIQDWIKSATQVPECYLKRVDKAEQPDPDPQELPKDK